jgi:hypothetical protein
MWRFPPLDDGAECFHSSSAQEFADLFERLVFVNALIDGCSDYSPLWGLFGALNLKIGVRHGLTLSGPCLD